MKFGVKIIIMAQLVFVEGSTEKVSRAIKR
jgi:hypothetical protein